ncbi:MAG: HAD family hydrolase [Rhodobacterales bacterium]|nr:HAD family hydrolase [Rhodobacterales bacterium]
MIDIGTPQAIFFDFDGVLVESIAIKHNAFRNVYHPHGEEIVQRVMAYHKIHEGISRLDKIQHCHREYLGIELTPDELAALGRIYTDTVEEAVVVCPAVPGSMDMLEHHSGRIPLFVVSGTPQPELRRIADRRGLTDYFTSVRGSPPRKEPIIEELLDAHGLERSECLFLGDATTDSDAAATCGLRFIGRVPPGAPNPFPPGTETVPDLTVISY